MILNSWSNRLWRTLPPAASQQRWQRAAKGREAGQRPAAPRGRPSPGHLSNMALSKVTAASPGLRPQDTGCLWQNCKWEASPGTSAAELKFCVWIEVNLWHFLDCYALGMADNWSFKTQCFSNLLCSIRVKKDPQGRESPCPDIFLWAEPTWFLQKTHTCSRDHWHWWRACLLPHTPTESPKMSQS